MNRRDVLKTTMAATAVIPLLEETAIGQAAAVANFKPRTLSLKQFETVSALCDLIIPDTDTPGAKTAGVPRYVDLFLTEGDPNQKTVFLSGLAWLDNYTNATYKKPFTGLTKAQQIETLTKMEKGEGDASGGQGFFRLAKGNVVRYYYQTELGFKELNKFGIGKIEACPTGKA